MTTYKKHSNRLRRQIYRRGQKVYYRAGHDSGVPPWTTTRNTESGFATTILFGGGATEYDTDTSGLSQHAAGTTIGYVLPSVLLRSGASVLQPV